MQLNEREKQIEKLFMLGVKAEKIGSELRLSQRTLHYYLAAISKKLSCS